jgi:hypothetical protein
MVVRLSALRAGLPLPPGKFLVLISVRGWVVSRAIVQLEGSGKLKRIHLIRTWTCDLPACNIAPQPTMLLHICSAFAAHCILQNQLEVILYQDLLTLLLQEILTSLEHVVQTTYSLSWWKAGATRNSPGGTVQKQITDPKLCSSSSNIVTLLNSGTGLSQLYLSRQCRHPIIIWPTSKTQLIWLNIYVNKQKRGPDTQGGQQP